MKASLTLYNSEATLKLGLVTIFAITKTLLPPRKRFSARLMFLGNEVQEWAVHVRTHPRVTHNVGT